MKPTYEQLEAENAKLRGERCYICRPDDPLAAKEGCSDCDRRSDDYHAIEELKQENTALNDDLQQTAKRAIGAEIENKALKAKVIGVRELRLDLNRKDHEIKSLALQLVAVREALSQIRHESKWLSAGEAIERFSRIHRTADGILLTPPSTLVAQMEKKMEAEGKIQRLLEIMQAWIKKAHHHDGCVRRYQPYPQRKDRNICDCRRVYILGEIEQTLALWNTANEVRS